MPKPAIAIRDLFFSYDKTVVLEQVNVTIEEGEFIGIFGPNGGGKTTLLKLMLGLLRPQKGTIELFGLAPKEMSQMIGYVPQVAPFDRDFPISVLEVVMMGCLSTLHWWGGYKKEVKARARKALETVGLLALEDQSFGTLSGGEAQRVLIARALVNSPKILILDEPTASVDPQAEYEIYQVLQGLKTTMTILMVTHDLQTMIDRAERFLCVQRRVSTLKTKEVCEHFALGLYHTPLTTKGHFSFP